MQQCSEMDAEAVRATPQFSEGLSDYVRAATCPYPQNDRRRYGWHVGFIEAQVAGKVGAILRKHGEVWP